MKCPTAPFRQGRRLRPSQNIRKPPGHIRVLAEKPIRVPEDLLTEEIAQTPQSCLRGLNLFMAANRFRMPERACAFMVGPEHHFGRRESVCQSLGVVYVTRSQRSYSKKLEKSSDLGARRATNSP